MSCQEIAEFVNINPDCDVLLRLFCTDKEFNYDKLFFLGIIVLSIVYFVAKNNIKYVYLIALTMVLLMLFTMPKPLDHVMYIDDQCFEVDIDSLNYTPTRGPYTDTKSHTAFCEFFIL